MRDFFGVLLIILFAFGILALITFLGLTVDYYVLVLIGIAISAVGIILFIKYFPGRHTPPDDDENESA